MITMTIELAGGETWDVAVRDRLDAETVLMSTLSDRGATDPVAADQWAADGEDDDGHQRWRLLGWDCEQDAEDDDGTKSAGYVAYIDCDECRRGEA